ncbi:MAG: hypothetical protein ACD_23C01023G0005 [uncultured bacterium]|nr:MAG: hypothetical protein ACD_23C01023G0005 [uncultured bacterium]
MPSAELALVATSTSSILAHLIWRIVAKSELVGRNINNGSRAILALYVYIPYIHVQKLVSLGEVLPESSPDNS